MPGPHLGGTSRERNDMHYLLVGEVVEDYAKRRVPLRAAHLAHTRRAVERGELVLGGALADPKGRGLA